MQPQPHASPLSIANLRMLILFAVVAVGGTMFYLSSSRADKARPAADRFIAALCAADLEGAQKLAPRIALPTLKQHYGGVYRMKRCSSVGFDGNPFGDVVQITYLCDGRPADRRNVLVFLRQQGERWEVTKTKINWHLGRGDRAFAERFVRLLAAGKRQEAAAMTRDVSAAALTSASEILGRGGWTLAGFRRHPTGKGARFKPRKVTLSFSKAGSWLSFDCMEQHGKRWIVKLRLP